MHHLCYETVSVLFIEFLDYLISMRMKCKGSICSLDTDKQKKSSPTLRCKLNVQYLEEKACPKGDKYARRKSESHRTR